MTIAHFFTMFLQSWFLFMTLMLIIVYWPVLSEMFNWKQVYQKLLSAYFSSYCMSRQCRRKMLYSAIIWHLGFRLAPMTRDLYEIGGLYISIVSISPQFYQCCRSPKV